jgi:hypothetical protein
MTNIEYHLEQSNADITDHDHNMHVRTWLHNTTPDNRQVWAWEIITPNGVFSSKDEDRSHITTGAYGNPTGIEMLGTLESFLYAYAEAQDYGPRSENYDLFPNDLAEDAENICQLIGDTIITHTLTQGTQLP